MEGHEIRKLIAKLTLYLFGFYLVFTYIQRNWPSGFGELLIFIMTFFLNFGTNWWLYKLQGLSGTIMQYVMIAMQWVFFGWTFYAFRFVYYLNMERDYTTFISTPMYQYAVIFPVFLVMLFASTRDR